MNTMKYMTTLLILCAAMCGCQYGGATRSAPVEYPLGTKPIKVTAMSFVRAETDRTMARYVKLGAFGKFLHIRQPTPLDKQGIIREVLVGISPNYAEELRSKIDALLAE